MTGVGLGGQGGLSAQCSYSSSFLSVQVPFSGAPKGVRAAQGQLYGQGMKHCAHT